MDMNEMIDRFNEWQDNDEDEKIIETILKLPENALNDDILGWLAGAYMNTGEYKKAIAVLESQRKRMDGDFTWHFMLAVSLYNISQDDEVANDDALRISILRRAKVELARGMNLNPPDELMEGADMYSELIEQCLHADDDEEDIDIGDLELYDEDDIDALEEHIKEYFGDFPTVLHEIYSPDIHCDIACIPPSKKRNYYTLMTMGMGAHLMNIPREADEDELGRAELLICLPPDWKVGENDNVWFWPIRLLKDLARLPIISDTWLGWGHSVDNRVPYAENTELCSSLLLYPEDVENGAQKCTLPSGDTINFFEVIPLHRSEMEYKIDHDTHALLEKMSSVNHVVDVNRPECCPSYVSESHHAIDSADDHSKKIKEKNLPLDPINGCNHIAIFMRWCIEHDLMSPEFHMHFQNVIDGVMDGSKTDLREFIMSFLGGAIEMPHFSFIGTSFAHYYYNWSLDDPPFYPADVDAYAEKYFGTEKYNSAEFQDEAYLFVPFDEKYYLGLSEYINRAFMREFFPRFARSRLEHSVNLVNAVAKKLGITGTTANFPEEIREKLQKAVEDSRDKPYAPLLLIIDDDGAIFSRVDLATLLESSLVPMLETVAVMKIPSRSFLTWAKEHFNAAEPSAIPEDKVLDDIDRRCNEKFGGTPCVLTFDNERSTLFMPVGGGRHICFIGEGLTPEIDS